MRAAQPPPYRDAAAEAGVNGEGYGEMVRHKSDGSTRTSAGLLLGYARVSTADQILDRQITELTTHGCTRVWSDTISGAKDLKPGLDELLRYVRAGDTIVVVELSRLGRNTVATLQLIQELGQRQVGLRVLNLGLDTGDKSPMTQMVLTVWAALAELEREQLRERIVSGIAEARRRGTAFGRPPSLTGEQRALVVRLHTEGERPAAIARLLGTSERTVRRIVAAGT